MPRGSQKPRVSFGEFILTWDGRGYVRQCERCGSVFQSIRSDAMTCSGRCRLSLWSQGVRFRPGC
jgi:hypothetical protein